MQFMRRHAVGSKISVPNPKYNQHKREEGSGDEQVLPEMRPAQGGKTALKNRICLQRPAQKGKEIANN